MPPPLCSTTKDLGPIELLSLRISYSELTAAAAAASSGSALAPQPASFISLQEVLHSQLHDILCALNGIDKRPKSRSLPHGPHWAHLGVAREDGKSKGEYSPILYPVKLFRVLHFENRWLSPTPDRPSKGWDAGSERILTTAVFEHRATSERLAVFNTHLDNAGSEARENSVAMIVDVIDRIRVDWAMDRHSRETGENTSVPLNFILTGDFNSFPTQEAYKAIVASDRMVDTYQAVPKERRYGNEVTFTGFRPDTDEDVDEIGRIDFVWFGPKSAVSSGLLNVTRADLPRWSVEGYSVLPNVFDDGVFCSDHRAVVADVLYRP
ncbi:hypothetical protein LTR53_008399 [Teratosphaeriaceae sp. CCFEE 6253]|nr:hypothetical protein LTR53_008399 [Teratosphaeriaceae sp. CCFEE 6253]